MNEPKTEPIALDTLPPIRLRRALSLFRKVRTAWGAGELGRLVSGKCPEYCFQAIEDLDNAGMVRLVMDLPGCYPFTVFVYPRVGTPTPAELILPRLADVTPAEPAASVEASIVALRFAALIAERIDRSKIGAMYLTPNFPKHWHDAAKVLIDAGVISARECRRRLKLQRVAMVDASTETR